MSVITAADEKLLGAKAHIQSAIEDLSDIVAKKIWGHDEFTRVYQHQMHVALNRLMEARETLETYHERSWAE